MKKSDLTKIFGQFVGKEIPMVERPYKIELKTLGQTIEGVNYELANKNDPVVRAMSDAASRNGLKLRLWWPGVVGTMDYRLDRVNIHIEKGADSKWRVSRFAIG